MSRSQSGKASEHEVAASLEGFSKQNKPFYFRRIQDYRDWLAVNPKLKKQQVPADFEALWRGKFYLIEVKSTRGNRFALRWVREHQKEALKLIEECGGFGFIIIVHRGKNVSASGLRIGEYLALEAEAILSGSASIPIMKLLSSGVRLERCAGKFDISPIFTRSNWRDRLRMEAVQQ